MAMYCVLENNVVVDLDNLHNFIPLSALRNCDEYFETVDLISKHVSYRLIDKELFANSLFMKSRFVELLVSVVHFRNMGTLKSIHNVTVNQDVIVELNLNHYVVNYEIGSLITVRRSTLLIQFLANRLFYFLGILSVKETSTSVRRIMRLWVETAAYNLSENHEKYAITECYIYPFGNKIGRVISLIGKLSKKGYKFRLTGYRYSIVNLLKLLISFNDELYLRYIQGACVKHMNEFADVELVLTSSEWSIQDVVTFRDAKFKFINVNHGMGFFSPYCSYTKIIHINEVQRKYYALRNSLDFELNSSFTYLPTNTNNVQLASSKLVLIDQGDLKSKLRGYEDGLYKKLCSILSEHDGEVFVKFHPNSTVEHKKYILECYGFSELQSFEKDKYTFFSLFSTAYYDFGYRGSFVFIKDDLFSPTSLFGDLIDVRHINELKNILQV